MAFCAPLALGDLVDGELALVSYITGLVRLSAFGECREGGHGFRLTERYGGLGPHDGQPVIGQELFEGLGCPTIAKDAEGHRRDIARLWVGVFQPDAHGCRIVDTGTNQVADGQGADQPVSVVQIGNALMAQVPVDGSLTGLVEGVEPVVGYAVEHVIRSR